MIAISGKKLNKNYFTKSGLLPFPVPSFQKSARSLHRIRRRLSNMFNDSFNKLIRTLQSQTMAQFQQVFVVKFIGNNESLNV